MALCGRKKFYRKFQEAQKRVIQDDSVKAYEEPRKVHPEKSAQDMQDLIAALTVE